MNSSRIFDWENILNGSENIKRKTPFPFGFIKKPIFNEVYDKLVVTYPQLDDKWYVPKDMSRSAKKRLFGNDDKNHCFDHEDPTLSKSWNEFRSTLFTDVFIEKMSQLTGVKLSGLRHFIFILNKKGDFNMPHAHHTSVSPEKYEYKVTILMYFAKGWKIGDPGGTYVCENEDESSIIFEPDDLDNSMIWFTETPISWHGSRYITKDVVRPSIQFTLH
jgi:hypothetical protein